jgi:hypothetical protein
MKIKLSNFKMLVLQISFNLLKFGEPYQPFQTGDNPKQGINLADETSWRGYISDEEQRDIPDALRR